MRKISKKGFGLSKLVISLVVVGFLLIIGLAMMGKLRDTDSRLGNFPNCGANSTGGSGGTLGYSNCSAAYNASVTTIGAIDDIPAWLPILVLAFIAVIVLGVVYMLKKR